MIERLALLLVASLALLALPAEAARESKVSQTKHNLSASGVGTTKSSTETQICVFCHTPHGADTSQPAPLWNKTLQTKTYTTYSSSSMDAIAIKGTSLEQPLGSSKLCLSCHDGAMQLGSVRVLRGQQNQVISVDNTGAGGTMPTGQGVTTGFTRQLGGSGNADLSNDHPISVTYDSTLSDRDGELRLPDASQRWGTVFGKRLQGDGYKPMLPLEPTGSGAAGQVQCTTCHDPHIRETNLTNEKNIKFLRANRFQLAQPSNTYSAINDIVCLACHDKGMQGNGNSWAHSAHANQGVATQTYKSGASSAAEIREFPDNIPVWKAACLNCHDTHTVTGSRRLLREGVDTAAVGGIKSGGSAALEEVCYQCHREGAGAILNDVSTVPNIRTDFTTLTYHMPITSTEQAGGTEIHDIGGTFNDIFPGSGTSGSDCSTTTNKCGADFVERRQNLGRGAASNRHAECTDCHNPHRVAKNRLFYGSAGNIQTPDAEGTHNHTDTAMTHTNVASGVLRGAWGVEPSYTSNSFHTTATDFTVRRGDPGSDWIPNSSATDSKGYVTREYQVCLKCHSPYGYTSPPTTGPSLSSSHLSQYTDQAKEFQAPSTHANGTGDGSTVNLGADGGANGGSTTAYNTNNHRSWHPVMRATGRTLAKRGISSNSPWYRPWSGNVGTQTMYCSDCHGSGTTGTGKTYNDANAPTGRGTVIPDGGANGNPWGPHGSNNLFLLKGTWDKDTGGATGTTMLCFKCHDRTVYTTRNDAGQRTGFYDGTRGKGNLHNYHVDRMGELQCTWCHVAVPHGWKNKMLLVNLNDVGEEAGQGASSSKEVRMSSSADYYTQEPYYLEAKLKIRAFSQSGSWDYNNCGSSNKPSANLIPSTNGNASGNNTGNNKTWMTSVCQSPP